MATRFNPPPNWPPAPAGWQPQPGWQPDPSWPPAPPGWQLWVDDSYSSSDSPTIVGGMPRPGSGSSYPSASTQSASPGSGSPWPSPGTQSPGSFPISSSGFQVSSLSVATRWAFGGGLAVFIGALLPFITVSALGLGISGPISGGPRFASAIFGLILVGLGAGAQFSSSGTGSGSPSRVFAIFLLVLSALGLLGYVAFTGFGFVGFNQGSVFGASVHVTYSPNIGLIMSILGCAAALYAGILIVRGGSTSAR